MAAVKEIQIEVAGARDLALIGIDDSVWLVVPLRWWDLSTLFFWLFVPADRRASVTIKTESNQKVSLKAVRVATKYVRVRGLYGKV